MTNRVLWAQNFPGHEIKKLQGEVASWKELIRLRMEENVLLKNMLTDIIKNNYNQNYLEKIEEFQTEFIGEDEVTWTLRREVDDLGNVPFSKIFENEKINKSFEITMNKLRDDITYAEKRFCSLTASFMDFHEKICRKNKN